VGPPPAALVAAEGRTIFVSSHLMNEMALTADHLIVIGRRTAGRDTSVEEFIEPQRAELSFACARLSLNSSSAAITARAGKPDHERTVLSRCRGIAN